MTTDKEKLQRAIDLVLNEKEKVIETINQFLDCLNLVLKVIEEKLQAEIDLVLNENEKVIENIDQFLSFLDVVLKIQKDKEIKIKIETTEDIDLQNSIEDIDKVVEVLHK